MSTIYHVPVAKSRVRWDLLRVLSLEQIRSEGGGVATRFAAGSEKVKAAESIDRSLLGFLLPLQTISNLQ